MTADELVKGEVYSWQTLSDAFDFAPSYLSSAGGMIARPDLGTLLVITHPGGAKSFDYNDYWEGDDLIYTGRGKHGDQKLHAQNKYVAENSHILYVFEAGHGSKQLKFLGCPKCAQWWWDDGPDDEGDMRKILRFRLRFPQSSQDEPTSPVSTAVGRAKFFGGGESEAHKALKQYVADHPEAIGLPPDSKASIEHSFKSPDRADIVFSAPDGRRVAVEIELEGAINTLIGGWQAAKYRTLLCLEAGKPLLSEDVDCVLVARTIPTSTKTWCHKYGVKCVEISGPVEN